MTRWRVACDVCQAGGWIGPRPSARSAVLDAWCEGCQRPEVLIAPLPAPATCPRCAGPLTLAEPRFEELLGDARNLAAVLHAWCGAPGPLGELLPDRPHYLDDLDPSDPPAVGGAPGTVPFVGDRPAARWNRAARLVIQGVAAAKGFPGETLLRRARAEAGEPSPYWSDQTVGRLLWTLLVERLNRAGSTPTAADAAALRSAEPELEFRTFWDQALVVHGYARLGMRAQAGDAAATLAEELLVRLAAEPFARGPAGAWLGAILGEAIVAVKERRPGDALATIRTLMERPDVSRCRVPCAACERGSLGVEPHRGAGPGG